MVKQEEEPGQLYRYSIKKESEVFDINRYSFKNGGVEAFKNTKRPPRSKLKGDQQLLAKSCVENDNSITMLF